jgi:hypothetical protein
MWHFSYGKLYFLKLRKTALRDKLSFTGVKINHHLLVKICSGQRTIKQKGAVND